MTDHGQPNPILNAMANAMDSINEDPDMHQLALAFNGLEPKAIEKLTPAEARQQPTMKDAVNALLRQQGLDPTPETLVPGVRRQSITVAGAAGPLSAHVYTPEGAEAIPVILYFHGGGWVIADADVYDASARGLAKQAGAIVVSVNYRQAPEHPFPAAWDDGLASYRWVIEHAAELGGDPTRLALAGESAGGNLAVATAIAARDLGLPPPRHILAVYPVAQTGSMHTYSYVEYALGKPLNRAMIQWFVEHLVRSDADKQDPRLDLIHAHLAGLPPVTLINAGLDPLCADGGLLEDALKEAGVPVDRKIYNGVPHEFFGAAAVVAKAADAQAWAGARLRQAFAV